MVSSAAESLGDVLRRARDHVTPAAVGLSSGARRRAVGLRREELSLLAGVSVDYITRLEQGRASRPSPQVLTALARALRLGDDERDHLFRLAEQAVPRTGHSHAHITPSIQRLLDRLDDTPVSVHTPSLTTIAWNPLWAALLGDPSEYVGRDRNLIWRLFTGQHGRVRREPHQTREFEASIVGDLRSAAARYPRDEDMGELIADLRSISPRFAELWDSGAVGEHQGGHKRIDHPEVGEIVLDCDVLHVAGSDLRIIVYTAAPGSTAADKLALLGVLGTQVMREA